MGASPPELVDWIDEDGRTLETLPRAEIRARNLLHRVTATFVFRADGRLYVQQRSDRKDVYPSLHDVFVGGTVVSGESFEANACREVSEELGVHGVPLHPLFGHRFEDDHTNSLIRVFACVFGGRVRLQKEEVAGGRWSKEADVERLLAAGQLCPDSAQGWRLYLAAHGAGRNFANDLAPGLAAIDCAQWLAGADRHD